MEPTDYSRFLSHWIEKFDPERSWLLGSGAKPPLRQRFRRVGKIWLHLTLLSLIVQPGDSGIGCRLELIYRLLVGSDSFTDTVGAAHQLAQCALNATLQHHRIILDQAFGEPSNPAFSILGMGKLGGRELNLSSDIDIFCVFAEDGETAGPRVRDHGEYFTRLTQQVAKSLETQTADGIVARVDQRLAVGFSWSVGDSSDCLWGLLRGPRQRMGAFCTFEGKTCCRGSWLGFRAVTDLETFYISKIFRFRCL